MKTIPAFEVIRDRYMSSVLPVIGGMKPSEIDNYTYFKTEEKAKAAVKKYLREEISYLRATLKSLK